MHAMLLAAALSTPAQAWDLMGYAWDTDDGPVTWYLVGSEAFPAEDYEDSALAAFEAWSDLDPCLELELEYGGILDIDGGSGSDGYTTVTLGDPDGMLSSGMTAVTYARMSAEELFEVDGETFYAYSEVDIFINPEASWTTLDRVDAEGCDDAYILEAMLAHNVGHLLGLGNSCDQGDSCTEDEIAAAMYWDLGTCTTQALEPNEDDVQGLQALYGFLVEPAVTSASGGAQWEGTGWSGPLPLEVCLEAASADDADAFTWDFGDGDSDSGSSVCHTWDSEGAWTVTLEGTRTADGCSGEDRLIILSCTDLATLEPGLISIDVTSETRGWTENNVPIEVEDCIEELSWEAWLDDVSIWTSEEWEPLVLLEGPGSYRLRLTVSGPGGAYTDEIEFEVEAETDTDDTDAGGADTGEGEPGSEECGCQAGGAMLGLWGLLGLVPLYRRRR